MKMEKVSDSKNTVNSHTRLNVTSLFSNVRITSQDNYRNNMVEAFYKTEQMNDEMVSGIKDSMLNKTTDAFYKTEQMNDEMVSGIKDSMLNKTTDAFYKTEQMNDEMVAQMIESCVGRGVVEEKFEHIEEEMPDLSMSHQKTQIGFLNNKKQV
jgi:hypothetical protein